LLLAVLFTWKLTAFGADVALAVKIKAAKKSCVATTSKGNGKRTLLSALPSHQKITRKQQHGKGELHVNICRSACCVVK